MKFKKIKLTRYRMTLALLLIAIGLRLWSINFSLSYRYHPNEAAHMLKRSPSRGACQMVYLSTIRLLNKYLLLTNNVVTYGLGRIAGQYTSQNFVNLFRDNPTLPYLAVA
jgi:hypothetical protein